MSFELKPLNVQRIAMGAGIEDLVWTQPRTPVPPLLADRISLSQWTRTFDAVYEHYRAYLEEVAKLKPWIYIPCCVCCMFPSMIRVGRKFQDDWIQLAQQEQKAYRDSGIQVALAKETISHGGYGGDDHSMIHERIIGLKFEIGERPTKKVEIADSSMVSQLERLNQMRKTGALSDGEYEQAKAKLLS
jgi:hypothetical protein